MKQPITWTEMDKNFPTKLTSGCLLLLLLGIPCTHTRLTELPIQFSFLSLVKNLLAAALCVSSYWKCMLKLLPFFFFKYMSWNLTFCTIKYYKICTVSFNKLFRSTVIKDQRRPIIVSEAPFSLTFKNNLIRAHPGPCKSLADMQSHTVLLYTSI